MYHDDDPGSGEKRERSEGRENRGGQAGAGKHRDEAEREARGGSQRHVGGRREGGGGDPTARPGSGASERGSDEE
jgi:hypothetical protein